MQPAIVVRNWAALVIAILALTGLGWALGQMGAPEAGAAVTAAGWLALAGFGLIDGILRVLGRPAVLGDSQGFNRLLALVQVLLSLFVLSLILMPRA